MNLNREEVRASMRQLLRSVIVGAMLIGWTGFVQAQTNAPAAAPSTPKKEAPKAMKMTCEIVTVNAEAKTIEVKTEGGKTETVSLSPKHKIRKEGKEIALSDLKPGEKCHCTYYEKADGTKSVSRIVIGEEKGKAAKEKESK